MLYIREKTVPSVLSNQNKIKAIRERRLPLLFSMGRFSYGCGRKCLNLNIIFHTIKFFLICGLCENFCCYVFINLINYYIVDGLCRNTIVYV